MDFKEMPRKDVCWINLALGSGVLVPAQYVISHIKIKQHCTYRVTLRKVHTGDKIQHSRHLQIISIYHSIIEFQIRTLIHETETYSHL